MNALSDRSIAAASLSSAAPAALQATAKSAKEGKEDAKIEKSAKDFEAILLGSWLQQAEDTFAKVPGGDDDEEDSATGQFSQMAMQSLGTSFAGSGGIGIAKMISAQLHKTQGASANASVAAPQTGNGNKPNPTIPAAH